MKACSGKALNLLVRLLDPVENPEADEMIRVFLTLDKAQYKVMKLDTHMTSSTGNKPAATKINNLLKDRRASAFEDKKTSTSTSRRLSANGRDNNTPPSSNSSTPTNSGEYKAAPPNERGFKAKLTAFLKARPTKEALEKKGVLKQARVFGHPISALVKAGLATDVRSNIIHS